RRHKEHKEGDLRKKRPGQASLFFHPLCALCVFVVLCSSPAPPLRSCVEFPVFVLHCPIASRCVVSQVNGCSLTMWLVGGSFMVKQSVEPRAPFARSHGQTATMLAAR